MATEEDINALLENSEHYRCGRWTKLVGITAGNNGFYQAYKDIIEGILKTSRPLGQAGSPMGWRGVLIDLDMAIWHNDPDRQKTSVDFRAVSRALNLLDLED